MMLKSHLDYGCKAHVEHSICFIQHKVPQIIKCHIRFLAKVLETTRRCDQNVTPALEYSQNIRMKIMAGEKKNGIAINLHWNWCSDVALQCHHTVGNTWLYFLWRICVLHCKSVTIKRIFNWIFIGDCLQWIKVLVIYLSAQLTSWRHDDNVWFANVEWRIISHPMKWCHQK